MSEEHPLLSDLLRICNLHEINEGKANFIFELYMELCEVQKLWEVEHHFHEQLKIFYLTGKLKKTSEEYNVYVPVSANDVLTPEYVELLQALLPNENSFISVLREQDSSSTHYRVTQGLVRPDSPSTAQRKKIEDKKFLQFQKYLERYRKNLYVNAMEERQQSGS